MSITLIEGQESFETGEDKGWEQRMQFNIDSFVRRGFRFKIIRDNGEIFFDNTEAGDLEITDDILLDLCVQYENDPVAAGKRLMTYKPKYSLDDCMQFLETVYRQI